MNRARLFHLSVPPLVLSLGLLVGSVVSPDVEETDTVISDVLFQSGSLPQEHQEQKDFEPVFVDWEKPDVALFISGRQDGYIEPCGCTGLANQLGGMMRRHTLLSQLQDEGWSVVGIDTGNQVRRFGRQANLKLGTTLQCLGEELKYSAVGFGPDDLKLPVIELIQAMANSGIPQEYFVCANVTVFDESFSKRYRVIDQGGKKIGLTMILGEEHLESLAAVSDISTRTVDTALAAVVADMKAKSCDVHVLAANTSLESCRELAASYPFFDLLICCGVDGEPTMLPEEIKDDATGHVTRIIQTGNKGMYVGVVGLFPDGQATTLRYQRVPLDARFVDSEPIKARFLSYQKQMQALGLEGLEIKAVPHPSGRTYVGSEACYDCHDAAYDIWKDGIDGEGGPHFRATDDLTDPGERTWVQRHYDPECISCHVTGWNPQQFFPYESGYLKLDDKLLHGNGCENCHGPGSMHVAAENGDIDVSEDLRVQYYKEMIVTLEQAKKEMCQTCHDLDNSPDFHVDGAFERYWDEIKHYEDE